MKIFFHCPFTICKLYELLLVQAEPNPGKTQPNLSQLNDDPLVSLKEFSNISEGNIWKFITLSANELHALWVASVTSCKSYESFSNRFTSVDRKFWSIVMNLIFFGKLIHKCGPKYVIHNCELEIFSLQFHKCGP